MVEFLNTEKAYSNIVEVVRKAKSQVVLISPYIKIADQLLERLKHMDNKGITTVVVCRGKDLTAEVKGDLRQLRHLELRFDENLHAKCFFNEESMVITSLNLLEHSQQHNREMGVLLTLKDDPDVFNEALEEAKFIVDRAKKDSLLRSVVSELVKEVKSIAETAIKDEPRRPKVSSYPYRTKTSPKQKGYCIRCGKNIPYDRDKPYCLNCARSWKKSGGYGDKTEKYCHLCGKQARRPTTKDSPLCVSCYWESRK